MAKQFASRLALIAFFAACARGTLYGSDFELTIKTALAATACFYGLGWIVGRLTRQLIEEHVHQELRQLLDTEIPAALAKRSPST